MYGLDETPGPVPGIFGMLPNPCARNVAQHLLQKFQTAIDILCFNSVVMSQVNHDLGRSQVLAGVGTANHMSLGHNDKEKKCKRKISLLHAVVLINCENWGEPTSGAQRSKEVPSQPVCEHPCKSRAVNMAHLWPSPAIFALHIPKISEGKCKQKSWLENANRNLC